MTAETNIEMHRVLVRRVITKVDNIIANKNNETWITRLGRLM